MTNAYAAKEIHELLEQHFPVRLYSSEDRLNALTFLLNFHGMTVKLTKLVMENNKNNRIEEKNGTKMTEYPVAAVYEMLHGRTGTLRNKLMEGVGDKMMEAMFFGINEQSQGVETKNAIKEVFTDEYRRMQIDPKRRNGVDIDELHHRGYELMERWIRISKNSPRNPHDVNSFEDLVEALKELRRAQGDPSLRTMAKIAAKHSHGLYGNTHLDKPRSHATLGRIVQTGAKPKLASVLAFVRGCGILSSEQASEWTAAHERAVASDEAQQT
jgi:hypothetical protein